MGGDDGIMSATLAAAFAAALYPRVVGAVLVCVGVLFAVDVVAGVGIAV
jgi:hypothetical protein